MRTYDCAPTLTDSQVLDFCRAGFLMLEGVVPDEINTRAFDYLDEHPEHTPLQILEEDWFVDNVILNPEAAGAIRSVLGKDFALTMPYMANHRVQCPGDRTGVASGQRLGVYSWAGFVTGVLLSTGYTSGAWPDGDHTGVAFSVRRWKRYEPLWQHSKFGVNGSACRLDFPHCLFDMAPAHYVYGERDAESVEVLVHADGSARARLDNRAGV